MKFKRQNKEDRKKIREQIHNADQDICRICLDELGDAKVIRPCSCTTWVHVKCLTTWLDHRHDNNLDTHICEVCKSPYKDRVVQQHLRQQENPVLSMIADDRQYMILLSIIWVFLPNLWRLDNCLGMAFLMSHSAKDYSLFYGITISLTIAWMCIMWVVVYAIGKLTHGTRQRAFAIVSSVGAIIVAHVVGWIAIKYNMDSGFTPKDTILLEFSWNTFIIGLGIISVAILGVLLAALILVTFLLCITESLRDICR